MAREESVPRQRTGAQRPTARVIAHPGRLLVPGAMVLVMVVLGASLLFTRALPTSVQAPCTANGITTGISSGQCAPNFTLADVQGKRVSLAQFRGHPVLLHFWAVACPTCAAEYPDFVRAVRTYVPRGLAVVGVDAWGEPAPMVQQWQASHHLPATLLIDQPQEVVRAYNVPGTPTTFFIDRAGRIAASASGPLTYADFQRNITRIL